MFEIVSKLQKIQYNFSPMTVHYIWANDSHMQNKWRMANNNLLDFFSSLDQRNKEILIEYIERH
jgi:hypothetical protein